MKLPNLYMILASTFALLAAAELPAQQGGADDPESSQVQRETGNGNETAARPAGKAGESARRENREEIDRLDENGKPLPGPTPGRMLSERTGELPGRKTFGFEDKDGDGINDRFADMDGDGINDVDNKPYAHRFMFLDADGDGVNDLFVDADGDGVNDLDIRWEDSDSDGICDNVVDTNNDGINDITGLQFSRKSLRGYKFGKINEERRFMMRNFIDENMDGLPDMGPMRMRGRSGPMPVDRFIDRDGDGIDDRRQPHQRLRGHGRGGGPK